MNIYSNPILDIYLNKDKKGYIDALETQGTESHKGYFDGVEYNFDHSHTLGTFYFAGMVGNKCFIVHAPLNADLKLFLGDNIKDVVDKSRSIDQTLVYKTASYLMESEVQELFDELFVTVKINKVETTLEKIGINKSDKTIFLREINKVLFANACVRIWANKKVSNLDLEVIKNHDVDFNDIDVSGDVLSITFGKIKLVAFKQSPIYIVIKIIKEEKAIYEEKINVGVIFPITAENKMLQHEIYKAVNYYFEHCL